MINADNLHEAEQEALGQLAQMDLALAARLHQLALNSDEPKEIMDLTRAYQRASRCVRQTIMLRARLRHERDRHLAAMKPAGRAAFGPLFDDRGGPFDRVQTRIDQRIMDLHEASDRIVAEVTQDRPRAERLDAIDRIDAWIDREVDAQDDAFGLQDLDEHVLDLCRANDLPEDLGRRFRTLPRAPDEDGDRLIDTYDFEPPAEPAPEPQRRDTG